MPFENKVLRCFWKVVRQQVPESTWMGDRG